MLPGPEGARNPALGRGRLRRAARHAARRLRAKALATVERRRARREARLRRRDRRLGSRRRRRRGGARRRGARRRRGRVRRLLRRPGLRRLRARRRSPGTTWPRRPPRTTRASACSPARASAAAPSSTTRPRSGPPTTCATSGRPTACRRSRPTTTRRASTRCASGSASTRSTTARRPRDAEAARRLPALGWHVDAMPRGRARLRPGQGVRVLRPRLPRSAPSSRPSRRGLPTRTAPARASGRATPRREGRGRGRRGARDRRRRPPTATARGRARARSSRPAARSTRPRCSGAPAWSNANIGTHLRLHPATAVFGVFDEELKPWEGVMQALYSDQHRDLDDGYGVKYETAADASRACSSAFAPVARRARALRLMEALLEHRRRSACCCATATAARCASAATASRSCATSCRSSTPATCAPGSTAPRRSSRPRARGACSARTPSGSAMTPVDGQPRAVHGRRRRVPATAPAQCALNSFHIMGSARMGGSPADLRVRPDRADLGRPRAVRARRLELPDRLGRQPADLDPGDRAHGRARACGAAELTARRGPVARPGRR